MKFKIIKSPWFSNYRTSCKGLPNFKPGVLFVVWVCLAFPAFVRGAGLNSSSSLNPVGSGARALSMGGAFIATADDASAATWNPAGLIQLERPEVSVVYGFDRTREVSSGSGLDFASTFHTDDLNLLAAVYPFRYRGRNWVSSLTFQRQFDLRASSDLKLQQPYEQTGNFEQNGALKTLTGSLAVQVTPALSVGMSLHGWQCHSLKVKKPENNPKMSRKDKKQHRIVANFEILPLF